MLLSDLIDVGAERHRARIAVRFADEALTFDEVDKLSRGMAARLARRLKPGSPVGILANNGLLSLPLDFACIRARLMRVPLNARLSRAEHAEMLRRLDVGLLIHSADLAGRAGELALEVSGMGVLALDDLAAGATSEQASLPTAQADDAVLALFTSGTTGRLKAVIHTQTTYGAMVSNILANLVDPQPGDGLLHAASLFHASGTFTVPYWMRGATAHVLPGFVPGEYLDAVERWRPTALMLVPTMLSMLLDHPDFRPERLGSVDTIIYGASPMPRPLIERALELLGPRFVQFYGQTEAPLAIAALSKQDHKDPRRLGSCGRPARDAEVRVDAALGEAGEVLVRAPFQMRGYYDEAVLNAETVTADGWLHTRDIGRFDEDGYLTLVDRATDMIITGGYNVYPKEVEDALSSHPQVRDAAVVGVRDARWGEAVVAFVVLRADSHVAADELIAYSRARLASYKAPKEIRFIEAIPVSAVGKPLRRVLREPFWIGHERRVS